ncbi:NAD-dependent epimerase/dehydratase family protein [Methanosarcina horonobensis]|uniref:NAD-dependent epimerase/dehydratase family protein n=1 Tax=Methanosarcina horonobensis TaxID=418008 RepID=UPI000695C138|nr:NAD-dependent epimerase/dehydratase family protein [Methanosarcina horonobensis]
MLFSLLYGTSNLVAEHYSRVFYEVYGPRMRTDLAISVFTKKMLVNEPIAVFGDGEQTHDFTYIDDIVWMNRRLLKTHHADGYAMNVGGGHQITVNGLIAHLREITGSASEVVHSDRQKGDAKHTRELVGYRLETTIKNGLKKFMGGIQNLHAACHSD